MAVRVARRTVRMSSSSSTINVLRVSSAIFLQWYYEMKRGSLAHTALHPNLALVGGHNFAGDRQSQPHAAESGSRDLEVILEDLLMKLRRNARSVVGDGEAHPIGFRFILPPATVGGNTHGGDPPLPEVQVGHQGHLASFRSILQG